MQPLTLLSHHHEVGNIETFVFDPGDFIWQAGQYIHYRLESVPGDDEAKERYFTIASSQLADGTIRISTRITDSDFKQALPKIKPGETILASQPEGDFVWDELDAEPRVLVAAGIGVTPYIAMLRQRQAEGKDLKATLVYYNRTDEIPFQHELETMAEQHPEFRLILRVGQPVSPEDIAKCVENALDGVVYLSGPEAMVDQIGQTMKDQGYNLKQDWFPGYTEETY